MITGTNSNRRQYYRYAPPSIEAPVLCVVHQGRRYRAERVIDVNLKGVRLVFPTTELTHLHAREPVTASIQAPGLDGSADLGGRVVFSFSRGPQLVVAIAFTDAPDLGDRVTAEFFSVFNRREDLRRHAPAGHDSVSALVLNADGEADGVIDLWLKDHSDKGAGFVVDAGTDAFMRGGAAVALPLPDRQQSVYPAQVRRRAATDDAVFYGVTFEGTERDPS